VAGGKVISRPVHVSEREQFLCIQSGYKAEAVRIDPDDWLLKSVTVSEVSPGAAKK
jgi:hypothetical protein